MGVINTAYCLGVKLKCESISNKPMSPDEGFLRSSQNQDQTEISNTASLIYLCGEN